MKVIIAGGRDFDDFNQLTFAVNNILDEYDGHLGEHPEEIVSGCAKGADTLGEQWAAQWQIPIKKFPADWDKYFNAAGIMRNTQMVEYADILIAFWDGESRGTQNVIQQALNLDLEVHVYRYTR